MGQDPADALGRHGEPAPRRPGGWCRARGQKRQEKCGGNLRFHALQFNKYPLHISPSVAKGTVLSTPPYPGIVRRMSRARWAILAMYTAGIFLFLPYTPRLVRWSNARFGPGAAIVAVGAVLALAGAACVRRLRGARAAFPWPHLALGALGLAAWAAWLLLASSPIGRVHLPEYGLLAILAAWAVGGGSGAAIGSGIAAAGVGLLDELVQLATPGRVFDWWDVALNAAAALLGGLACAWWRWTAKAQP